MKSIDLRSDTITRPTPAMRKAMAEAEVGDDVFGEDPTVRRLEEIAASRMGKDAALFVASGTMGNLVSQLAHCGRGDEMILGDQSHIFLYEQGGSAAVGGIHHRTLPNRPDGTIDLGDIESAIRTENDHFPETRLIVIENTHNQCNGSPIGTAYMGSVGELARKHDLKFHVDGARIFNASAALDTAPSELAAKANSISFCLSKALAAPVGSVVCGNAPFVAKARRARKVLGGGMRQAGVLAAAGIVALNEMADRLVDDHANARKLAEGLANVGLSVDLDTVRTNIVFFKVRKMAAAELAKRLEAEGVRVLALGPDTLRAVTNYHVTSDDINDTLVVFSKVMA